MSNTFRITILAVLLASIVIQPGYAQQRKRAAGFSLYARALLSEDRKPSIKVSAHVPYSNLVFFKKEGKFEAKFKLYIRIYDRNGDRMLDSAVRTKRETVSTYEDTKSQKDSATIAHQIEVPPGKYLVRCTVQVSKTQLAFGNETSVTVPDIMQSGVSVTKPRLFAIEADPSEDAEVLFAVKDGEEIYVEQQEQAAFIALDRQPAFQFDVYLERAARDSTMCDIAYEVITDENRQVLYGKRRIWLSGVEDQFVVTCNVDEWTPGEYAFNVKATVFSPTRASVANLPFELEFTRAMLTDQWETTVGILAIIGSDDEISSLEGAAEKDRASLWAAFWARRDPTPGTERNEALDEHWRRVRYAENEFANGGPGWTTDRGKIYIRHGEPDETEIRSDPSVQGQYLVWRYYKDNLTFVFYDRFGLGEYILSNSGTF